MKQATADFVENKGQWNKRAKFLARGKGMDFWVTQSGVILDAYAAAGVGARHGHVLDLHFVGSNPNGKITASHETNFISQYVKPKQPVRNAHSYKDINVSSIYPGVDLHFYKDAERPRYDLIVAPGADPNKIQMRVGGSDRLTIAKNGNLNIKTSVGNLQAQGLFAYQMVGETKHQIPASFVIGKDRAVRFALGAYDHSKTLVIDPIIYGSFYGGDHGMDEVRAVVADADGGVFMTGSTFASDFPLVLGPYVTKSGNTDSFISKFQGDAYVHNFASYFGGPSDETGKYIALDPSGNSIWIAGTTSSATFPLVGAGSYQQVRSGPVDTYIIKWVKDPNQVLVPTYATYFGTTVPANGEEIKGFGIGPVSGDVFIAGITTGTGIPGALNAYTAGAPSNGFITRMNNTATAVTWSRYVEGTSRQTLGFDAYLGLPALLGGTNPGTTNTEGNLSAKLAPNDLAIDDEENSVIAGTVSFVGNQDTGVTPNPAFRTTPGVFLSVTFGQNGRLLRNNDLFVEKLDSSGALFAACVVGGADNDLGGGVAVDKFGNVFVTGIAASHDFPRTFGTFGQVFTQQPTVTVTKLNQDFSQILYSTNLRTHQSPSGQVYPTGISVDSRGFVFVTGLIIDGCIFPVTPGNPDTPTQASQDKGHIPTTGDAIRPTYTYPAIPDVPSWDGWLIVLDDTATNQIYGTYLGGLDDDMVFPPYNDRFGDVWVVGYTDTVRAYASIDTTGMNVTDRTTNGGIGAFITPLAFKVAGEEANPNFMQLVTTPYGILDESGNGGGRQGFWATPNPPPFGSSGNLGLFISTGRERDGYVMRFRLQIPIIQSLVLAPQTIPGGLGASSTGTITLDTPATGAGVDVVVTLSDVSAASFDATTPLGTEIVNIPAGQTTGTFTLYSSPVTSPTQVDVKASYLGNFKQARLTVVPWLQNFVLSPSTAIGGNNVSGVITLAAPAPAGGIDVTLLTDDASTILFPGGSPVNVPAGQSFLNFQIATKGVDTQHDFTVTASALSVGVSNLLTLKPASLLSVTFQPGRVAGGTSSTGTVRLDGLPGPSGFNVDLSIVGNPVGYSALPSPLPFTPNDRSLDFTVTTKPETVNTSKVIVAHRAAQGTYSDQTKQGTLFIDANFLTNLILNPTTVNAGQTSTGTVTISNTAQAGGVVVNLSSDNPAVATVPATVTVPSGSTLGTFTVSTLATATDTVVHIHAIRGTADLQKPLTVKGVVFTLTANPNSVIGGAQNITGTIHLALAAPVGGVPVSFTSSVPAAASVPSSPVTVPQGVKDFNFTIVTSQVAATQNVTITGQTQPGTTATVIVQIRAISLANLIVTPTYIKGGPGQFIHIQVTLDAPAPAGGANVTIASSNSAVINPPSIHINAGQTQSAVIPVAVARVNRTFAVTLTGAYNGRQIAQTVTVVR